jgi:hypothetical protein
MMATTHAFVGAALASVTLLFAPASAPAAMAAGFLGGIVPDLDVAFDHRRTLHFPVFGSVLAAVLVLVAAVAPSTATIALAAFVLAAAVHPVMDHLGGSREPRPWLRTTDRAVYDHYGRRWLPARRWIDYDGSPADFGLGVLASVPVLAFTDGPLRTVTVTSLLVSIGYTVFRRRVFDAWDAMVAALPPTVLAVFSRSPESVRSEEGERDR